MKVENETLSRIAKLYNLAIGGVGGEKENAKSILAKFLDEHHIDVSPSNKSPEESSSLCWSCDNRKSLFCRIHKDIVILWDNRIGVVNCKDYIKKVESWDGKQSQSPNNPANNSFWKSIQRKQRKESIGKVIKFPFKAAWRTTKFAIKLPFILIKMVWWITKFVIMLPFILIGLGVIGDSIKRMAGRRR
ncbi:MAG: hypothetical protein NTW93_00355 [Phycisphaerae bacterium]|nr:hypothetical protein [Phycisphaerae bacterium]